MTSAAFDTCPGQFFVPTPIHGDVVVMDDLAAYKMAGVLKAIQAAGVHVMPLQLARPT
jgi:hypothetical protein